MTSGWRLFFALTAAVVMPAIGIAQNESYPLSVGSPLTRYPVYDAPFSATAVTTVDLRLPDGSRIARRTTARYFRDGAGRTRVEHMMEGLAEPRTMSERHVRLLVVPNPCEPAVTLDPTTRTIRFQDRGLYGLTTGGARSFEIPVGGVHFLGIPRPESIVSGEARMPPGTLVDDEPLGSRMLAGVETFGRRITVNTLAWQVGNERPIVVTDEAWYSPDLRLLIAADYSNSDLGTISYRLTGLSRSEPPTDLFTVPDDYQWDHSSTPNDPWMSFGGVEAYLRSRLREQPSRGR